MKKKHGRVYDSKYLIEKDLKESIVVDISQKKKKLSAVGIPWRNKKTSGKNTWY